MALDGYEWSEPRPDRFAPGKEIRYPLNRRLGGPYGLSWQVGKSHSTGIRSPDRPASRESLYLLHPFMCFHQKKVNVSIKQANGRRPRATGIGVCELWTDGSGGRSTLVGPNVTSLFFRVFWYHQFRCSLQLKFKWEKIWCTVYTRGCVVAQWLKHYATNRQVAGFGVIGIFQWHNPSGRTMALWSTQPLTEMSTRYISWG